MDTQNFTCTYTVDQSPAEVFAAIVDVPRWWTGEVEGSSAKLGDEFTYRYGDIHYSRQQVTELVPGEKLRWRVVDSSLDGLEDPSEWTGTEVSFDIARKDDKTEIRFAHLGLKSDFECYDSCSSGWGFFISGSLRRLITTGNGPAQPPWTS
jgi:uncharacterized protein YndB with AHSA1/START domain